MREYLPVLIVGAIIGTFAIVFLVAYIALQKSKEHFEEHERNMADGEIVRRLLGYAKPYWKNFVLVFFCYFCIISIFCYFEGVTLVSDISVTFFA